MLCERERSKVPSADYCKKVTLLLKKRKIIANEGMRQSVTSDTVYLTQCLTNYLSSIAGFGGMEHVLSSSISIFSRIT